MQHRGNFSVSVSKDYLVFASAHFITFAGHRCEGLHGHNYRASVTLEGALNEDAWFVFDFVGIRHPLGARRYTARGSDCAARRVDEQLALDRPVPQVEPLRGPRVEGALEARVRPPVEDETG